MATIGLIGGMSWESTLVYYRLLNERVRASRGKHHSADILLRSLDFEQVIELQQSGRWDAAGRMLGDAAAGLEAGGADCILICTNTMHIVSGAVEAAVDVPLIDIIDETGGAIRRSGFRRPLLLATRYTMEHGFYAEQMRERSSIEVLTPLTAQDRAIVHDIIFDELCHGIVRPEATAAVKQIVDAGRDAGADCVILGCTELCLLLDEKVLGCPVFDSTAIHVEAALAFAENAADAVAA